MMETEKEGKERSCLRMPLEFEKVKFKADFGGKTYYFSIQMLKEIIPKIEA